MFPPTRRPLALLAALLLLAVACTDSKSPSGSAKSSEPPPTRIVSLSPTATETLSAIGAGSQVVASDERPDAQAVAAHHPDLVIIADDSAQLTRQLTQLDIPVLLQPRAKSLDDAYNQITELGTRTGHEDEARSVVRGMQQRVADLTKDLPAQAAPLTASAELDPSLHLATPDPLIEELFALAGVRLVDAAQHPDVVVPLDAGLANRWGPRLVDLLQTVVDQVTAAERAPAR